MIFGWRKPAVRNRVRKDWAEPLRQLRFFHQDDPLRGMIRFDRVSLAPAFQNLSLQIDPGSWVMLYGEDDFAKAIFCDLCFGYILPESGSVSPGMKGSDVSFLGRSNTTYGQSLLDHLSCGVKETTKELMEFAVNHILSKRFHRHLSKSSRLEFSHSRNAPDVDLDERDFLEIAEANLLLQKRKAAVIDTSSDFYQIALEQGFRHSDVFLNSGKTIVWIIGGEQKLGDDARPWDLAAYSEIKKISLSFPSESPAGYLN